MYLGFAVEGVKVGAAVGMVEGVLVGAAVGVKVGAAVGMVEGVLVGAAVGVKVGAYVPSTVILRIRLLSVSPMYTFPVVLRVNSWR